MKKKWLAAALAVILLMGGLTACQKKQPQKFSTYAYDYFDTVTTITGYADSKEAFDKVANNVLLQLKEYHQLYDIYRRYSGMENLCSVNDLVEGKHPTVKVDQRIIDLLLYAKEMHRQTDGMVNVAMGSVLKLWHDHRTLGMNSPETATLPRAMDLLAASKHTDINNLVIDQEAGTVTLTDPGMRLDMGAIAKGYAVEQVALWLEEKGISGYVLNVGGNVRTVGGKPDGSAWQVGIENPENPQADHIAILELDRQALVTSGSYQRYYLVEGKKYHHIIHPNTRMPATGLISVSVICLDSGQADALSTALFCLSVEKGKALVESLPDTEALWVDEDGAQFTSSGWNQYVKES